MVGTWHLASYVIGGCVTRFTGVILNGGSREELALSLSKGSRVNRYNLPWAKCQVLSAKYLLFAD